MDPASESKASWTPGKIVAAILCSALVLATLFVLIRVIGGAMEPSPPPTMTDDASTWPQTAERLDRLLESRPEGLRTLRAFRTHYPTEYWAMLERVIRRGPSDESALYDEARRFLRNKSEAIASAPDADLMAIAAARVAAFETMQQTDVALCARVFQHGWRHEQPPAVVARQLDRFSALHFAAARHGEDGGGPPRPRISDADRNAWRAKIRSIDAEVAAMVDSGQISGADEVQCRAAVTGYRATAELPPELSARVTAELIRQAAQ